MSVATLTGLALVAIPLAFNAVFALLAARFEYPDILRRPTSEGSSGSAPAEPGSCSCGGASR